MLELFSQGAVTAHRRARLLVFRQLREAPPGFVFGHVVHPASGWNGLADMWAAARKRPGELTYGTSGIATDLTGFFWTGLTERIGLERRDWGWRRSWARNR